MIIRKAVMADIEYVSEIYEKIHREEALGRLSTGWTQGVYPTKNTACEALQRGELFVGLVNGDVVGSAVFNQIQVDCYIEGNWERKCSDEEIMVMHTLTISPEYAGCGLGKKFLLWYENYAAANHCKALRIDTQEKNTVARAMYKSYGFKEVGVVGCDFNGISDVMLVLLEKPVNIKN